MPVDLKKARLARRGFLGKLLKGLGLLAAGGLVGRLFSRTRREGTVWQIDPHRCTQCGKCATECILTPSASKCFHDFSICGYCRICTGFLFADASEVNEGAENQLCPVGAITRKFVEEPYYEYTIDRDVCIGCARCVQGCESYGNGSLYLQIDRTLCVNCNECAAARACEGNAIMRIPASRQYIPKKYA
jgi:electron transport complex protein RnfB